MPTMDYEAAVTRTLAYIESAAHIHPENKQLIKDYHRDMVLADISSAQQQKVLSHFKIITDHVGQTRFVDLDKEAIVDLVAWLYTRGTSSSTVVDYKQAIKQFWKWLNDGEDPEETKWIRRGPVEQKRILPQNLLTPADVQALLDACHNERDRAFVAVLWETGARIGELIDLQVEHIEQTALESRWLCREKPAHAGYYSLSPNRILIHGYQYILIDALTRHYGVKSILSKDLQTKQSVINTSVCESWIVPASKLELRNR